MTSSPSRQPEYYVFEESSRWHEARDERVVSFLRFSAWLVVVGTAIWILIGAIGGLHYITAIASLLMLSSVYALGLIRRNRITFAKNLLFFSATAYFLFAALFLDGPDRFNNHRGTAHFWFIALSIYFYFIQYDSRPLIRDTGAFLLLLLFFLFHFNYISIRAIADMPQRSFIDHFTVVSVLIVTFILTRQFSVQITNAERALTTSADNMQGLIENILPKPVADRLTREKKAFADSFTDCSVMFADIVGFTSWAERHSASEVADRLNGVFSRFDEVVERTGLTKIKTTGDCYMVVAGLPETREDHAAAVVRLAFEFHRIASAYDDLAFRIGINSGPVAAGVIGKKRFIYDLWGDTVNTASRMQSACEPGKVNISGNTFAHVGASFSCTPRGKIEAKNKGMVHMYFVES